MPATKVLLWIAFIIMARVETSSQESNIIIKNRYGLQVIETEDVYEASILLDSNQRMVSLTSISPDIALDLRYATTNNFMHKKMYPSDIKTTFLRLQPARALALVQKDLNQQGLGLKVFDAYRPYAVTEQFWRLVHDERYVANPAKGSGHNRGIAVDLTIIDLQTGEELDMGTGFDNFTDTAHQDFIALPESILQNRKLLRDIMRKYGFIFFETEWWHYAWTEPEKYPLLNLSFDELEKIADK